MKMKMKKQKLQAFTRAFFIYYFLLIIKLAVFEVCAPKWHQESMEVMILVSR